jgi:hypothetical protein
LVQQRGRYRSRSMMACPLALAYTSKTMTWAFSTRPAVQVYWRCTPDRVGAVLEVAALVDDQHRLGVAQVGDQPVADVVAHLVLS